jgi:hypothetical protein
MLFSVLQVRPEVPLSNVLMPQADILLVLVKALWNELGKAKLARHKVREVAN